MNRLVALFFILIFLFGSNARAAIASGAVWEVRATATAANVNGGAFNPNNASPGTDYSQQDSSQFNGTNLASSNGSTNPCVVTSATHNFVSTDNGNYIHINSGTNWTAGWYEIVSTSGNAATLDRACGSSASLSSGTWHEGGAISLGDASDSTWAAAIVSGNTIYYKKGSYTAGAQLNFSATCLSSQPCKHIGYNATRTDSPTGSNRPTIDSGGTQTIFNVYSQIYNLILTQNGANGLSDNNNAMYYNVKAIMTSTTAGRIALAPGTDSAVFNSEIIAPFGIGINCGNDCTLVGNYIHDSATGVKMAGNGNPVVIINNIFAGNYTQAINSVASTGLNTIYGNTFYGYESKIGIGANIVANATNNRFYNNIFYGLATGITIGTYGMNLEDFNDFNNVTTPRTNIPTGSNSITAAPGFANVTNITGTSGSLSGSTLTASGFSNVTDNVDYCYISSGTGATPGAYLITAHTSTTLTLSSAPGGSGSNINYQIRQGNNFAVSPAMKWKGFPAAFPAISTTSYNDLGAAQRHEYGRPRGKK